MNNHACCLHRYTENPAIAVDVVVVQKRGAVRLAERVVEDVALYFCCREPCRRLVLSNVEDREEKTHGGAVFASGFSRIDVRIQDHCPVCLMHSTVGHEPRCARARGNPHGR